MAAYRPVKNAIVGAAEADTVVGYNDPVAGYMYWIFLGACAMANPGKRRSCTLLSLLTLQLHLVEASIGYLHTNSRF